MELIEQLAEVDDEIANLVLNDSLPPSPSHSHRQSVMFVAHDTTQPAGVPQVELVPAAAAA